MSLLDRLIVISFVVLLLFALWPQKWSIASEQFETAYDVHYELTDAGQASVTQKITLTNKLASAYATSYSLTFSGGRIENIRAQSTEGPLKTETVEAGETTTINLSFNQQILGKGKELSFSIYYDALDLVQKNGQIWEVAIPKVSGIEEIDRYNLTLTVPEAYGETAFIAPKPAERQKQETTYIFHFTKDQISDSGISVAFGQIQIFDFILNYHLKNPRLLPGETEISLPPDTAFQRVAYKNINPPPLNIALDEDGNWLARYRLGPQEKLNIVAVGKATIFAQPQKREFTPTRENLNKNLLPQPYWEVEDPLIRTKAGELKTPFEIYQFVVKTLEYDFSRVREGAERLGALRALKDPKLAICTEFTDLFITLARAAGIPTREINGYAYTTNPKLRPLGLVVDVLHAWPEYWDEQEKIWFPIDPTWGKTTGGGDYFSKTDLNRIIFAIHGQDSQRPYPAGSYKADGGYGKDVQVVFGQYEGNEEAKFEIEWKVPKKIFFLIGGKGKIIIKNVGSSAAYNLNLELESKNIALSAQSAKKNAPVIFPYSRIELPIGLKAKEWFRPSEGTMALLVEGQKYTSVVKTGSFFGELIFPPLFIIILAIGTFYMLKVKRKHVV